MTEPSLWPSLELWDQGRPSFVISPALRQLPSGLLSHTPITEGKVVFDPGVGVSPSVPLCQEPLQHPADPCMGTGSLHALHLLAWCESVSAVCMCNYILELQFVDTCIPFQSFSHQN